MKNITNHSSRPLTRRLNSSVSELKGNGNGKNLHLHGQDRTQEASQCDQGEVEKPA